WQRPRARDVGVLGTPTVCGRWGPLPKRPWNLLGGGGVAGVTCPCRRHPFWSVEVGRSRSRTSWWPSRGSRGRRGGGVDGREGALGARRLGLVGLGLRRHQALGVAHVGEQARVHEALALALMR